MYDEEVAKICRLENGYVVHVYSSGGVTRRRSGIDEMSHDPWRAYTFKTSAQAIKFLEVVLPKLSRRSDDDEFAAAFVEVAENED